MSIKVKFWEGKWYMLSNFSAHEVEYRGVVYKTAEHAYQVSKFIDGDVREKIAAASSAYLAREYGQQKEGRAQIDKVEVMKEIMCAKLEQHEDVRTALLETLDSEIEKNHPDDRFWGTGKDGKGRNVMGQIWIELREGI